MALGPWNNAHGWDGYSTGRAPSTPKSSDKKTLRTGKNPPGFGKFSPVSPQAGSTTDALTTTSEAGNSPPNKISAGKTDGATGGAEKSAARADGKISLNLNAPAMAAESLPVFVSLPLIARSRSLSGPAGGLSLPWKLDAVNHVSSATSQTATTGKITSEVLPTAGNVMPVASPQAAVKPSGFELAVKVEKNEVEPVKNEPETNLPLKNLSPVTPAVEPAGSAELAAVLEKNIPGTPTTQIARVNLTALMPETKNVSAVELAAMPGQTKAAETNGDSVPLVDANAADSNINSGPEAAVERATENAGTGVAMTDSPMKNPQKTNKVAGPDVKVLPGGETGVAREKNLPLQLLVTPVRAADNRGTDLNFTFSNGSGQPPVADKTPVLNVLDLPSLADARVRAVERTQDMMALHSMRLVESKSDSLSVVIKPAVGTELSLELRQRAGGVEAQATLTRGDHQFLSQHWPELQQRLEQRGIKLAPLGGEANFSANDNGNFSRHQASREDAAQQAAAFAEFASIGRAGGATARLAPVHGGWESWA